MSTFDALRRRRSRAPALRAASASVCVTVPMPPRTIIHVPSLPGRRHMLWTRKFIPVPGVSQVPSRPEKPSVTAYIAFTRSLLKSKRSRYSPTGPRHRSTKILPQRGSQRSARRSLRSRAARAASVGATSSRSWLSSRLAALRWRPSPAPRRTPRTAASSRPGPSRRAGSASPSWAGSSADRGAAAGRSMPSSCMSSGGIRPSRYAPVEVREVRRLREGTLGARRAADDRLLLDHGTAGRARASRSPRPGRCARRRPQSHPRVASSHWPHTIQDSRS